MYDLDGARGALEAVDLRQGLAVQEVHSRLSKGLHLRETGQRILAFYLTEMAERRLHQDTGHRSAAHFAEDRLGLPRRRARELIAVGRKLLSLPQIDTAFCEGRLGWSKLLHLVRVATPEHEAAWLEEAHRKTTREMALEAKVVPAGRPPRKPGQTRGLPEVRYPLRATLDVITHQKLERAKQKFAAERGKAVSDAELLAELAEMFLNTDADGSIPGRTPVSASLYRIVLTPADDGDALQAVTDLGPVPVDGGEEDPALSRVRSDCIRCDAESVPHGDRDVATSPALRRRVLARDHHRCRCCGSTRGLMVHHIRYRSHGGATRAWNLITLCTACHAMVHAGLLFLRGQRAARIRFADIDGNPVGAADGGIDPGDLERLRRVAEAIDPPDAAEPAPPPEPKSIDEAFAGVVGQAGLLERLGDIARASRKRGRCFPHTLFVGPAGTGKTTLARGIAACYGARLVEVLGPLLSDVQSLRELTLGLGERDVLFIDEIHAVPRGVLETLYHQLSEERFTLLAATTEDGDLPHALHSRFAVREALDLYAAEDLVAMARAKAVSEGFQLEAAGAHLLARCARGTPRELLRLLQRALDRGTNAGTRQIDGALVRDELRRMGFDADGLDPVQQRYLKVLRRSPRPVSLARLARLLGTTARALFDHVEPDLFRRGLIELTERGREAANVRRPAEAAIHG